VFELEGTTVIDVRAYVFGVGQHLMNGRSGPGAFVLPKETSAVESFRYLSLCFSVINKELIDVLDHRDLRVRAGDKDDPISLQAFPFPTSQKTLGNLITVNQLAPQPVTGRSALPEPKLDEPALSGEDFDRKLTAVFRGHGALQGLENGGRHAPVVLKLLCAVVNPDAGR